jgi:hypothetical protein
MVVLSPPKRTNNILLLQRGLNMEDVTDFEVCRRLIVKIVQFSLEHRNILHAKKLISNDEYLRIGELIEEPLLQKHNEYTLEIFGKKIQVMTPYMVKIHSVTRKLDSVLDKLQKFNDSINFLSEIVNFFGEILTAASRGIAGIPDIFSGLEAIIS